MVVQEMIERVRGWYPRRSPPGRPVPDRAAERSRCGRPADRHPRLQTAAGLSGPSAGRYRCAAPLRVARLAEAVPEIAELDLNPVMALSPGHGCRIVDARIRVVARATGLPAALESEAQPVLHTGLALEV